MDQRSVPTRSVVPLSEMKKAANGGSLQSMAAPHYGVRSSAISDIDRRGVMSEKGHDGDIPA